MPALPRLFPGPVPLGLSLSSGLLLTLAFPRPGWWPLVFVGLVPLVLVCRNQKPKTAFGLGCLAGLAHAATLLYWLVFVLTKYGGLPLLLALPTFFLLAGYMALFPALFTLGLTLAEQALRLRWGRAAWMAVGAALYCGLEYFKGFFLTGFPWEPLGGALGANLPLLQFSDIVGTEGLTFFVVWVNLSLAAAAQGVRSRGWRAGLVPAALGLGVVGLLWTYGHFRLGVVETLVARAPHRTVAVVQGNIDQSLKWDAAHRFFTLKRYQDLTLRAAGERPWLIVWPETAAPFFFLREARETEWLLALVRSVGRPVLFGSPAFEESGAERTYYNRAYLVDGRGRVQGQYDKEHLVPYGEYVPLKRFFPFLGKITQAVGDYSSGPPGQYLELDGARLGVLICYESIFPELSRARVAGGADFLINITNDAWFGRSAAPDQHFAQAVLRAVENRRTLIRAANTGISGFVWPTGRTRGRTRLLEEDTLLARVPWLTEESVYTAVGDLGPQVCLGVTVFVFAAGLVRRRSNAKRPQTTA